MPKTKIALSDVRKRTLYYEADEASPAILRAQLHTRDHRLHVYRAESEDELLAAIKADGQFIVWDDKDYYIRPTTLFEKWLMDQIPNYEDQPITVHKTIPMEAGEHTLQIAPRKLIVDGQEIE